MEIEGGAAPRRAKARAGPASRRRLGDAAAPVLILVAGGLGYLLFPDNLALLTRIVCIALLVLSLDLVTGYCGIATLGHAALFGAGAYAAGIAAVHGIREPLAMLAIGGLGGALAGLASGAVIARAHGLTQLVLSIAVVQLLHEGANKASAITGGSDGLSGIDPLPLLGLFPFDLWGRAAYGLALALLVLVFLALRVLVRSPFGMLCRAIRQDPVRVRAMGGAVYPALVKMYVISGAVAGLGGALGAISTQVVGIDSVGFTLSATALVILVLGGVGTLSGAIVGAAVFLGFEHVVSAADPFNWLTLVGVLLVAVVLFAPRGLVGSARDFCARRRQEREG